MLKEIESQIPNRHPDLKIGPVSIWVSGYTWINQIDQGDQAYLKTPILLNTKNVVVFSENSETPIFHFKEFIKCVKVMYENISTEHIAELPAHDSEFSLKLTNNNSGHIRIDIQYHSWVYNGKLEFEDKIDQSYLPEITRDLEKIIKKHEQKQF